MKNSAGCDVSPEWPVRWSSTLVLSDGSLVFSLIPSSPLASETTSLLLYRKGPEGEEGVRHPRPRPHLLHYPLAWGALLHLPLLLRYPLVWGAVPLHHLLPRYLLAWGVDLPLPHLLLPRLVAALLPLHPRQVPQDPQAPLPRPCSSPRPSTSCHMG